MQSISDFKLKPSQAAIWFLGQSGFVLKSFGVTIAIDPYLSDSVAKSSPKLTRAIPVPIEPSELKVDIFMVTHDHLDHLDPETIEQYRYKDQTVFVGPRFVCRKLRSLNISEGQIIKIDVGETQQIGRVRLTGVYTVPNEPAVVDTAGYLIKFENGRSIYHTSDTDLSPLLLKAAPTTEVGLFCINGKWGNLDAAKAVTLAAKIKPRFAIPHHYDVMELNSENPHTFEYFMSYTNPQIAVKILNVMEPFVWGPEQ
jgi:L-ascorbate 6-phosphate lactonase